jgi:hypothetical protein
MQPEGSQKPATDQYPEANESSSQLSFTLLQVPLHNRPSIFSSALPTRNLYEFLLSRALHAQPAPSISLDHSSFSVRLFFFNSGL